MGTRRLTRQQRKRIRLIQQKRHQKAVQRTARQLDQLSPNGLGVEQNGLVIANFGPALIVENHAGDLYRCAVRQNLGTLVCGDRVIWQMSGIREGVVIAAEDRHSLLTRQDYSGHSKPVAANLDQIAVVVAPRPGINEFLIDRYLIAIALIRVTPLLVVNKVDLLDKAAMAATERRFASYRRIGYAILYASTRSAHGLDELLDHLKERTSILVGQSGVGKSSLIQALLPDREIRTQALSEATGRGTHATTTSTLYHLPVGGNLIDSPGVRSFEPGDLHGAQLEHGFIEFKPFLGHCKFSNCSHKTEPGCALQAAVERGEIEARRLQSYHQIKASPRML